MFAWTEESAAFWEDSASYTQSYERLAERAAARLSPEGNLFEGGCGLGHLSVALAKRGFAVTAMDLSPLPLRHVEALPGLTVRQGDVFALPKEEVYDGGLFCFFGGVRETLRWAQVHCRENLILFKKNWDTHRFTRDPGAIRKFTYPLTAAELKGLGVPFETEVFEVDMGQPFRSLSDAVRFFRLYDSEGAMTEGEVLPRLTETGDPTFPYYLPAIRPVGMIVLRAEDIRKTFIS
jgi:SAM-dependent methyltransferase